MPTTPAEDEINVGRPVTVSSLFRNTHYSHGGSNEEPAVSSIDGQLASVGLEAKIAATETRLGFGLPEALRVVYLHQNGGWVPEICLVKAGVKAGAKTGVKAGVNNPRFWDDILLPFGGYDDLNPCELLRTVFDSVCDYADPNDGNRAAWFPDGCERMIVIAQWYRKILFLDYTETDDATVALADFDDDDWRAGCVRWPNFATFFSQLRHFDVL